MERSNTKKQRNKKLNNNDEVSGGELFVCGVVRAVTVVAIQFFTVY